LYYFKGEISGNPIACTSRHPQQLICHLPKSKPN
jgi:hypothetical protein